MQSKQIGIAAGVLALALVAAYLAFRPKEEAPSLAPPVPAPAPDAAAASEVPPPGTLNSDLKAIPPQFRAQVESALKEAGATRVQVATLDARMARGRNNMQWVFTPPALEAPDWQREAWDKNMAPLVYPDGHPKAGQWRDSVSPEDVQKAAEPIVAGMFGEDYLDQPIYYVPQKRINFNELNMASSRLWNRDDPSTARAFYEWLKAAPEDPSAYPSDFQLPAEAGDPDAITYREFYGREILQQAREQMAEQRGQKGS
jgi:hypothetical protein